MSKEQVNHPSHYNSHPNGIECIDIISHYTCDIANAIKYLWRAGLKPEMGKDDADKEIEDLHKALWYIEHYRKENYHVLRKDYSLDSMLRRIKKQTGYDYIRINEAYNEQVGKAITHLLCVGLICGKKVCRVNFWESYIDKAVESIQQRILDIEFNLTNKELEKTVQAMNGQAIDGEEYVSKPGGKRETEPDNYDPLNIIIVQGTAYCLSDEVRKKPNGALYGPCDNCALSEYCVSNDGTESLKNLCNLHYATDQQYYREVGTAKYAPSFGTIEVVDDIKEMQIAAREMEEED